MTTGLIPKDSHFYKIIDDKFKKYKKSRKNIWKIHNMQLQKFSGSLIYYRWCHSYCMWELIHEQSFKNKLYIMQCKMEKKINKYINILLKITNNRLLDDVMIYIAEFIISRF